MNELVSKSIVGDVSTLSLFVYEGESTKKIIRITMIFYFSLDVDNLVSRKREKTLAMPSPGSC